MRERCRTFISVVVIRSENRQVENMGINYLRFLSYHIVHKASAKVEVSEIWNEDEISLWRIASMRW